VNYIEMVNQFWQADMEHNIPSNSTRLYFGLLNMSNRLGWKNPFGATNQQLAALVNCDEKTLIRCRKVLVKTGLISVKRGCKNTPNSITLNAIHWNISSTNASINASINASENASHHKTETKTKSNITSGQVDQIYDAYPLKVGRKACTPAITRAIQELGFDKLLKTTQEYAKVRGSKKEYTPHPKTWFGQGRYNDDPESWADRVSESSTTSFDARKQLELVETELKQIKERHAFPEPGGGYSWHGVSPHLIDQYKRLVARRKELKPIAMGL
tara:strand:+ start:659 stop:1474 length:816 start_codon:yes stop_codon:yes gene_type:complete